MRKKVKNLIMCAVVAAAFSLPTYAQFNLKCRILEVNAIDACMPGGSQLACMYHMAKYALNCLFLGHHFGNRGGGLIEANFDDLPINSCVL